MWERSIPVGSITVCGRRVRGFTLHRLTLGSRLCRDEVQPVRGGQIKRIADERRRRIDRRIHLDLPQQLLSPSGTKNGHAAFDVPNVKPVAGQQEASPNGPFVSCFQTWAPVAASRQ